MRQYFSQLFERSGGNVKVELDLTNYATKADLKGATSIDASTYWHRNRFRWLEN